MEGNINRNYTPEYVDRLLPNQIFVFGSNTLGYHTGGASRMALNRLGAIWGQAESLKGHSNAISVDYGKGRVAPDIKFNVHKFIEFAKEHPDMQFLVTRVGCGIAGFTDIEMVEYFKEALTMNNGLLPSCIVNALKGDVKTYDLDRFLKAQDSEYGSYPKALNKKIRAQRGTMDMVHLSSNQRAGA